MNADIERIVGGPGTGKTHLILDRLTQAKAEMGLSHSEIGLCTFTRAGRAELAARASDAWGCDVDALTKSGWFRTAHSISHRQCGIEEGALLEGSGGAKWISESVGGSVEAKHDPATGETFYAPSADDRITGPSLRAWDLARSRMVPLQNVLREWTTIGDATLSIESARHVVERYESCKRSEGRVDYTDMVARFAGIRFTVDGPEESLPEGDVPDEIKVLAIDEAQDSSALVDRVCRRLAASDSMRLVLLTGDPYQSVFRFGGSDFRHFMSWDARESIMPRSHRCPPVVMKYGERCIRQMRSGYRDRGILPASHDGSIVTIGSADEAVSGVRPDESCLILGRCGFALDAYEIALVRAGIPYIWVDKQGSARQLSGFQCLFDIERGKFVSGPEWATAVSMTPVGHEELGKFLKHGEKTAWASGRRSDVDILEPSLEDMTEFGGATETWFNIIKSGDWPKYLETRRKHDAREWREAAVRFSPELASNPKVRLSTIHSAKGLEGDTVILSTISSGAVTRARQRLSEAHDEECRINYVAVTRARRKLVIVRDAQHDALELPA